MISFIFTFHKKREIDHYSLQKFQNDNNALKAIRYEEPAPRRNFVYIYELIIQVTGSHKVEEARANI